MTDTASTMILEIRTLDIVLIYRSRKPFSGRWRLWRGLLDQASSSVFSCQMVQIRRNCERQLMTRCMRVFVHAHPPRKAHLSRVFGNGFGCCVEKVFIKPKLQGGWECPVRLFPKRGKAWAN
ncbi:hypothetical protein D9M69_527580 [compost metagenome]